MKALDLIAWATDEELISAYWFARRCNQWKTVRLINLEAARRAGEP